MLTNDFFRAFLSLEFGGVAIKVPVFINFFGINQPLSQNRNSPHPKPYMFCKALLWSFQKNIGFAMWICAFF